MIDWQQLRKAKQREVAALAPTPITEIVPSRRDFGQFLGSGRTDLTPIPTLRRRDPSLRRDWSAIDAAAWARTMDDGGAAAIAVTTDAVHFGGRLDDLTAVAAAATAPVLQDDFALVEWQLYTGRLHGADAAVVPVAWLSDAEVGRLVTVAASIHTSLVLGIFDGADLPRVLAHDKAIVGLWAQRPDGSLDADLAARVSRAVPARRTLLLLGDTAADDWPHLRGLVDAALVAAPLLDNTDPGAALAALLDT